MTREGKINHINPMGAFMNPMMSMGGTMDVMKSGNSNNNCNGGTMDVIKSGNSNNNCNGGTIDVIKSGNSNNNFNGGTIDYLFNIYIYILMY